MAAQTNSILAFEILNQWKEMIGDRSEDREKIGPAVCKLLDEAVECVRQLNNWTEAERCCDWGFDVCQRDPADQLTVTGMTGQIRDLHFPQAAIQFHRGVFLLGQSKLGTASEYFRMSARSFFHSHGVSVSSAAMVGACLSHWACGKVTFVGQEWGKALQAYQHALDLIDKRDARAEDLRRLITSEIEVTQLAIRRQLHTQPHTSPTPRSSSRPSGSSLCYVPILAKIAAGTPLPTGDGMPFGNIDPDNLLGELFLDAEHARGAIFGLLVKGDSMCEAGIFDGDYALIRKQEDATNGAVAAVRIERAGYEDEATLKKYFKESEHWFLEPANRRYKPIVVVARSERERIVREYAKRGIEVDARVDANVKMIGRVVAVWRRM